MDTLFTGGFGLVRRHWQLLRWVAERDEPRAEAMRRAPEETGNVVLDGLDEADYAATVRTMADNLERANRSRREQPR